VTWLRLWPYAAALALLLAAAAGGWHLGAGRVQARWDVAELQRERQAAELRAEAQRLAQAAATRHEAQRRRIEARLPGLRRDLADALRRPLACPTGAPVAVGDVLVPAAAVDRLRDAGADPAGD
jgi:hypothetical protein